MSPHDLEQIKEVINAGHKAHDDLVSARLDPIKDMLHQINKDLRGNGQPGLIKDVAEMKNEVKEIDGIKTREWWMVGTILLVVFGVVVDKFIR